MYWNKKRYRDFKKVRKNLRNALDSAKITMRLLLSSKDVDDAYIVKSENVKKEQAGVPEADMLIKMLQEERRRISILSTKAIADIDAVIEDLSKKN